MELFKNSILIRALGILILAFAITDCAKSSKSSSSNTTANNTGGYITCPASGQYVNNGYTYSCLPGTQVYANNNNNNNSQYITCPSTGTYTYNNQTYTCVPGTSVYIGGQAGGGSVYCTQFTQYYGVPYVLVYYQGIYQCARKDVAQQMGLPEIP